MKRTDIEKRIAANLVAELQAACVNDTITTNRWDNYEFTTVNGGRVEAREAYSPALRRWKLTHAGVEFRNFSWRENHRITMALEEWTERQNMSEAERQLLKLDEALRPNTTEVEQAANQLKTWVAE